MKFISVMNHDLSQEQLDSLGDFSEIVELPQDLRKIWGSIPAEGDLGEVIEHLRPVASWLKSQLEKDCTVNIAGELSAVFTIVNSLNWGLITIVTATTRREVVETPLSDGGTRKQSVFHHVRWRRLV